MSFTFFSQSSVAVVRWDRPEGEDIEALASRLAPLGRASGAPGASGRSGRGTGGVVFVQCIAGSAPPPSREVAALMASRLHELAAHCQSLHAVFEGRADTVRFKRAWLTGMLLAANDARRCRGEERVVILAHDSLDEVAHHVPLGRACEVRAALRCCGEGERRLEGHRPTLGDARTSA